MENGYGRFCVFTDKALDIKRFELAHRFSWMMANGPVGDSFVLHRCDNRRCVRPDHLFLGNALDNMRDCIAKGRRVQGSTPADHCGTKIYNAKLTERLVAEMRDAHAAGETLTSLAAKHGVALVTVHKAVKRKTWKHVA